MSHNVNLQSGQSLSLEFGFAALLWMIIKLTQLLMQHLDLVPIRNHLQQQINENAN